MIPRLHLVSDDVVLGYPGFLSNAIRIAQTLGQDVALHVRSRQRTALELFGIAERLADVTQDTGTMLLVNDRIDVALAVRADGVQLGVRSIPVADAKRLLGERRVGYSAHAPEEAAQAARDGADWVFAGSIYPTASHPDAPAAGIGLVSATAAVCEAPVIAIGGITEERVAEVRAAGAHGVAIIRAIWEASDPVQAARHFARLLEP